MGCDPDGLAYVAVSGAGAGGQAASRSGGHDVPGAHQPTGTKHGRRSPTHKTERSKRLTEAGQKLLEVKAALPRASFLQWVEAESGMHYQTVKHYMRLAKAEADQQERSAA
jgi:hypothetical protein